MIQEGNGKRQGARIIEHPQDWDKVLSAAYLRLTGETQEAVATAIGCARQTISVWEGSPFWPNAVHEATERWLSGLREKAMKGLETGVGKDGKLALDVLERLMPELSPATQRFELTNLSAALARLPMKDLRRLEDMSDEELAEEIDRLVGSTT